MIAKTQKKIWEEKESQKEIHECLEEFNVLNIEGKDDRHAYF